MTAPASAAASAPSRPDLLVAVVGTGTEVGKTWVSVRLIETLSELGYRVEARKPVQSYDPSDPAPKDAQLLAMATGEDPAEVCSPDRSYPMALAPPMAASLLGRPPILIAELASSLSWSDPGKTEKPFVGIIEMAGGVRSPMASDGDAVEFVRILLPEVLVMVAHAGLGTLNAVRLTAEALSGPAASNRTPSQARMKPTRNFGDPIVVLNRYSGMDDVHELNRRWLIEQGGFRVVIMPGGERDLADAVLAGLRQRDGSDGEA